MRSALLAYSVLLSLLHGVSCARMWKTSPSSGSLAGGTRIVISGRGFLEPKSAGPFDKTTVYVGTYDCAVLPTFGSAERIVCETKPIRRETVPLAITVQIFRALGSAETVKCSAPCTFQFSSSNTPRFNWLMYYGVTVGDIFSFGDDAKNLKGSTWDQILPMLGSTTCDADEMQIPNPDPTKVISCRVQEALDPGHVEFSVRVLPTGLNDPSCKSFFCVSSDFTTGYGFAEQRPFTGVEQAVINQWVHPVSHKAYDIVIYPEVHSVTPSKLSPLGGRVVIAGRAFSGSASKSKVTLGGRDCNVIHGNTTHIICEFPAVSNFNPSDPSDIDECHFEEVYVGSSTAQSKIAYFNVSNAARTEEPLQRCDATGYDITVSEVKTGKWVDIGCWSSGSSFAGMWESSNETTAYVRCCTLDGKTCESEDWDNDEIECSGLLTYGAAEQFCESKGHRLCSRTELRELCCGTGCGYDSEKVWTSSDGLYQQIEVDVTGAASWEADLLIQCSSCDRAIAESTPRWHPGGRGLRWRTYYDWRNSNSLPTRLSEIKRRESENFIDEGIRKDIVGQGAYPRVSYSEYEAVEDTITPKISPEGGQSSVPIADSSSRVVSGSSLAVMGHSRIQTHWGFFVPPFTANYTFYVAADDFSDVSLALTPGSSREDELQKLASCTCDICAYLYGPSTPLAWYVGSCSNETFHAQRFGEDCPISSPVELVANETYFFRHRHGDRGGSDWSRMGILIEDAFGSTGAPSIFREKTSFFELQTLRFYSLVSYEEHRVAPPAAASNGAEWTLTVQSRSKRAKLLIDGLESASAVREKIKTARYLDTKTFTYYPLFGEGSSGNCIQVALAAGEYTVKFNCDRDVQDYTNTPILMTFTVTGGQAELLQEASEPISGTYRVEFEDKITTPINVRGTERDLAAALRAAGIDVEVFQTKDGVNDWTVAVRFTGHQGDVEELVIVNSTVTGANATYEVYTIADGNADSLFYDPIPADWFRSAHEEPQLEVWSNDVLAANRDAYSNSLRQPSEFRAVVLSAGASDKSGSGARLLSAERLLYTIWEEVAIDIVENVRPNDTLSFVIDNVVDSGSGLTVFIGNAVCAMALSECTARCNETHSMWTFECNMGPGHGGIFAPRLLLRQGYADAGIVTVEIMTEIETFGPTMSGSLAGGTEVTITGMGLSQCSRYQIGGANLEGDNVGNSTSLTCRTPALAANLLACTVEEMINTICTMDLRFELEHDGQSQARKDYFNYTSAETPIVLDYNPKLASAADGASIVLTGTRLADAAVMFGDVPCFVEAETSSDTKVECRLMRYQPTNTSNFILPLRVLSATGLAMLHPTDVPSLSREFMVNSVQREDGGPARGSFEGGAVLHIQGTGFGDKGTVKLRRPNRADITCAISSWNHWNDTHVTCQVGAFAGGPDDIIGYGDQSSSGKVIVSALTEVILSRNSIEAICANNDGCTFEYNVDDSFIAVKFEPLVGVKDTHVTVIIAGHLDDAEVYFGGYTCESSYEFTTWMCPNCDSGTPCKERDLIADCAGGNENSTFDATMISLDLCSFPAGKYLLTVKSQSRGKLKQFAARTFVHQIDVTSASPLEVSRYGGEVLTLRGTGFGSYTKVWIGNTTQCIPYSKSDLNLTHVYQCITEPLLGLFNPGTEYGLHLRVGQLIAHEVGYGCEAQYEDVAVVVETTTLDACTRMCDNNYHCTHFALGVDAKFGACRLYISPCASAEPSEAWTTYIMLDAATYRVSETLDVQCGKNCRFDNVDDLDSGGAANDSAHESNSTVIINVDCVNLCVTYEESELEVESITPVSGANITEIELNGTFGEAIGKVIIGDFVNHEEAIACAVTLWEDGKVVCALPALPAGVYPVKVWTRNSGYVFSNATFTSEFQLNSVSTVRGSMVTQGPSDGTQQLNVTDVETNARAWEAYRYQSGEVAVGDANYPLVSGIYGGVSITIAGVGLSVDFDVRICGRACEPDPDAALNTFEISCIVPSIVDMDDTSDITPNSARQHIAGRTITYPADNDAVARNFDGNIDWPSGLFGQNCEVGFQPPVGHLAQVATVRAYAPATDIGAFQGMKFQVSNDTTTWTDLFTLSSDPYRGWNTFAIDGDAVTGRTFRFTNSATCNFHEVKFYGRLIVDPDVYDIARCPVILRAVHGPGSTNPHNSGDELGLMQYRDVLSPVVSAISPKLGTARGGTEVTVTGENFAQDRSSVFIIINGYECTVTDCTDTTIACVTSARNDGIKPWALSVRVLGKGYAREVPDVLFRYLDKWSDARTWSGYNPPIDGDLVHVPYGQALLVDVSTPILYVLIVEGLLVFDDKDLTLDASYIWINGGTFEIGREGAPFTKNAVITLHGTRNSIELPFVGAKGLTVSNKGGLAGDKSDAERVGVLDLHGIPRVAYSRLAAALFSGQTELELVDDVDWEVGDPIVLTNPTEEVEVVEVIAPNIVRVSPAEFDHEAEVYTYGGEDIDLRPVAGLKKRNIVIRGDEASEGEHFGAHTGAFFGGLYRIENTEFTRCGQAGILGRYCTHFHIMSPHRQVDVDQSYVRYNVMHNSYQRATTVHESSNTKVVGNFAFHVMGHAFFIESGPETDTLMEYNVAVRGLPMPLGLPDDLKPAGLWSPTATFIWRHNLVFDFPFGYRLNPKGGGEQSPLIEWFNNTSVGCGQGFQIFPPLGGDHNVKRFRRTLHFKCGSAQFVKGCNTCIFEDEKWIESNSGMSHKKTSPAFDFEPLYQNLLCVGHRTEVLRGSKPLWQLYIASMEFWQIENATFVNYGDRAVIRGGFAYPDVGNAPVTVRVRGLVFDNSSEPLWTGYPSNKVIYADVDGSLTGVVGGWAISGTWPHNNHEECSNVKEGTDVARMYCSSNVTVRSMYVQHVRPWQLRNKDMQLRSRFGVSTIGFVAMENYGWSVPMVAGLDVVVEPADDLVSYEYRDLPYWYTMTWPEVPNDFEFLQVLVSRWQYCSSQEWFGLHVPYDDLFAHHWDVTGDVVQPTKLNTFPVVGSGEGSHAHATSFCEDSNFCAFDNWYTSKYSNESSFPGLQDPKWVNLTVWDSDGITELDLAVNDDLQVRCEINIGNDTILYGTTVQNIINDDNGSVMALEQNKTKLLHVTTPFTMNMTYELTDYRASQWLSNHFSNATLSMMAQSFHESSNILNVRRRECAYGGCPTPTQADCPSEVKMWSDPAAWPGNRVPEELDDVEIRSGLRIILDISPPKLGMLTITGTLAFLDDPTSNLKLLARSIIVWGELEIGTVDAPFEANATVALWGNTDSPPVTVVEGLFLHNKVLVVLGRLNAFGLETPQWTKLASTAESSATSIIIYCTDDDAPGWLGREIVISPTEYPQLDSFQADTHRVLNVTRVDNMTQLLTIDAPLQWRHYASGRQRAAVGILDRNVKFTSEEGESDETGHGNTLVCAGDQSGNIQGACNVTNVEFRYSGLKDYRLPAFRMQYLSGQSPDNMQIRDCSFVHTMYAIDLDGTTNLVVDGNVFYDTYTVAVNAKSTNKELELTRNLAIATKVHPMQIPKGQEWYLPKAAFHSYGRPFARLAFNYVGGAYDIGFQYRPELCFANERWIEQNEAVGSIVGFFVLRVCDGAGGGPIKCSQCAAVRSLTAWKNAHIGVTWVDMPGTMKATDLYLADNHIGVTGHFHRSEKETQHFFEFRDSVIYGSTAASANCQHSVECRAYKWGDLVAANCNSVVGDFRRIGLLVPIITNRGKTCEDGPNLPECDEPNAPDRECTLPWEQRYGIRGSRYSRYTMQNVTIGHFAREDCGKRSVAITVNPTGRDYNPGIRLSEMTFENVMDDAKYLLAPAAGTGNDKSCTQDCDGVTQTWFTDMDGSFLGVGAHRSVVPTTNFLLSSTNTMTCTGVADVGQHCAGAPTLLNWESADHDCCGWDRRELGKFMITRQDTGSQGWSNHMFNDVACPRGCEFGHSFYPFAILPNLRYKVEIVASMPKKSRLQWFGEEGDYVLLTLKFTKSLQIRPYINGAYDKSLQRNVAPTVADVHGAHMQNPQAQEFVILLKGGGPSLFLQTVDVVQVTQTLDVPVAEFVADDFINNIALLLGISPDRIKVVDVRAGSTIVDFNIEEDPPVLSSEDLSDAPQESQGSSDVTLIIPEPTPVDPNATNAYAGIEELQGISETLVSPEFSAKVAEQTGYTVLSVSAEVTTQVPQKVAKSACSIPENGTEIVCTCLPGTFGNLCEEKCACESDIGYGRCDDGQQGVGCVCKTGYKLVDGRCLLCVDHYYGTACRTYCNIPAERGNCTDSGGQVCSDGFTGDQCARAKCPSCLGFGVCSMTEDTCECEICICDSGRYGMKCEKTAYWRAGDAICHYDVCGQGVRRTLYSCAYKLDNGTYVDVAPESYCAKQTKPVTEEPCDNPYVGSCACHVQHDTFHAVTTCRGLLADGHSCSIECQANYASMGKLECIKGMLTGNVLCVHNSKLADKVEAVESVIRVSMTSTIEKLDNGIQRMLVDLMQVSADDVLIMEPGTRRRRRLTLTSKAVSFVVLARALSVQSVFTYLRSVQMDNSRLKQLLQQALSKVDSTFVAATLSGVEMTKPVTTNYFGPVPTIVPSPAPGPTPTPVDSQPTPAPTTTPFDDDDVGDFWDHTVLILGLVIGNVLFLVACGFYYAWQKREKRKFDSIAPLISFNLPEEEEAAVQELEGLEELEVDFNGAPTHVDEDGMRYWGRLVDGKKEGHGKCASAGDQIVYVGTFATNEIHGYGKIVWRSANGQVLSSYVGLCKEGQMHGRGAMIWNSKWAYIGEFADGVRSGRGRCEWMDRQWYDGQWRDGEMCGIGEHGSCLDRVTRLGQFRDGHQIRAIKNLKLLMDPRRMLAKPRQLMMRPKQLPDEQELSETEIYFPYWGFTVANPKYFVAATQNGYLVITKIKRAGALASNSSNARIFDAECNVSTINLWSLIISVEGIRGVAEMVEKLLEAPKSGMRATYIEMEVCPPMIKQFIEVNPMNTIQDADPEQP
eukprot:GEMP01000012.1.p1 GENE.GEMP01000012.1~~GEMP01000012.1.p1  ORF type:complete len:4962 (-),score=849.24 GEMP01000012.1:1054-15939(-)